MTRTLGFSLRLLLGAILWLVAQPVVADAAGARTVIAKDYRLAAGEELLGDLTVIAGRVYLEPDSRLEGNLAVVGGEVHIGGLVNGNVVVFGGTVDLDEAAIISGDVVVFGRIRRHPGATVRGSVIEGLRGAKAMNGWPTIVTEPVAPPRTSRADAGGALLSLARTLITITAVLLICVLVAVLLPENEDNVSQVLMGSALLSLAVGLLTIMLVVVLVPLLTIICIGIPIALIIVLAFVAATMMGWAALGRTVGARLFAVLHKGPETPVATTAAGTLLITLVSLVPCVGWAFAGLLLAWCVGAVVLSRLGTVSEPFWPAPTSSAGRSSSVSPESVSQKRGDTKPLDPLILPDDDDR